MSKYYVPVRTEGKWWVVKDPEMWAYRKGSHKTWHMEYKAKLITSSDKYPTLESDRDYWASKVGVKMTSEEFKIVSERYPTGIEDNGVKEMAWEEPYAIPIQSPTTKELIELIEQEMRDRDADWQTEANTYAHEETKAYKEDIRDVCFYERHMAYEDGLQSGFVKGCTFALSLPKQDNGDEVYLKLILKIQSWVLDDKTKDTDKLLQDLKQHYSISKIK